MQGSLNHQHLFTIYLMQRKDDRRWLSWGRHSPLNDLYVLNQVFHLGLDT